MSADGDTVRDALTHPYSGLRLPPAEDALAALARLEAHADALTAALAAMVADADRTESGMRQHSGQGQTNAWASLGGRLADAARTALAEAAPEAGQPKDSTEEQSAGPAAPGAGASSVEHDRCTECHRELHGYIGPRCRYCDGTALA